MTARTAAWLLSTLTFWPLLMPIVARLSGAMSQPPDVALGFVVFATACLIASWLVTGLWGASFIREGEAQDLDANIQTFIFGGVTGLGLMLGLVFYTMLALHLSFVAGTLVMLAFFAGAILVAGLAATLAPQQRAGFWPQSLGALGALVGAYQLSVNGGGAAVLAFLSTSLGLSREASELASVCLFFGMLFGLAGAGAFVIRRLQARFQQTLAANPRPRRYGWLWIAFAAAYGVLIWICFLGGWRL